MNNPLNKLKIRYNFIKLAMIAYTGSGLRLSLQTVKTVFLEFGARKMRVLLMLLLSLALYSCNTEEAVSESQASAPKLILIIGDGMDDQQVTIARNYLAGNKGTLLLDRMPYRGAVQIVTVNEGDPSQPVYVADSANTATSMATGGVTSPSRIGTTPGTDQALESIIELAEQAGFSSGLVTSSSVTDATPASFAVHINSRACHGPENMLSTSFYGSEVDCSQHQKMNGGLGSISEQLVDSGVDVILGGGRQYFAQVAEGEQQKSVLDVAVSNGYQLLSSKEDLAKGLDERLILGLFADGNLPVRLRGENGAIATPIERTDGSVELTAAFACEPNPQYVGTPSLREMTEVALGHFDEDKGFFLMVESASIDKQSHARNPCGALGELEQLNEVLEASVTYAQSHPETLILVTADHAQAAQILNDISEYTVSSGLVSPGFFARVRTPEGSIMGVNYATSASPTVQMHTGAQVPLYAYGPGLENLPSFLQQPDIFDVMVEHLGLR